MGQFEGEIGVHDPIVLKISGTSQTTTRSIPAKFGDDPTKDGYAACGWNRESTDVPRQLRACGWKNTFNITGIDRCPARTATFQVSDAVVRIRCVNRWRPSGPCVARRRNLSSDVSCARVSLGREYQRTRGKILFGDAKPTHPLFCAYYRRGR